MCIPPDGVVFSTADGDSAAIGTPARSSRTSPPAADSAIRTTNDSQAAISTRSDLIALIDATLADDGENDTVIAVDGDLILIIDADNHPRGDLILIVEGVVPELESAGALDTLSLGAVADMSDALLI